MFEILVILGWVIAAVLGLMWLFLPWIIISKLDEVIKELKKLNAGRIAS